MEKAELRKTTGTVDGQKAAQNAPTCGCGRGNSNVTEAKTEKGAPWKSFRWGGWRCSK
ncbi:MAG: hypothetical protein WC541_03765 [Dehalococcoidia bacterium]